MAENGLATTRRKLSTDIELQKVTDLHILNVKLNQNIKIQHERSLALVDVTSPGWPFEHEENGR